MSFDLWNNFASGSHICGILSVISICTKCLMVMWNDRDISRFYFFFHFFSTYHELFGLRLILNCGRENVGGFNVHKINSKNDDAVYWYRGYSKNGLRFHAFRIFFRLDANVTSNRFADKLCAEQFYDLYKNCQKNSANNFLFSSTTSVRVTRFVTWWIIRTLATNLNFQIELGISWSGKRRQLWRQMCVWFFCFPSTTTNEKTQQTRTLFNSSCAVNDNEFSLWLSMCIIIAYTTATVRQCTSLFSNGQKTIFLWYRV